MRDLLQAMAALALQGESFVLATVITRNGSAPRSAGAKMLVRQDGSTLGTVGGGILEAQVETLAKEMLHTHAAVVRSFQFSGKDAATMDAICGGQVEVLVEWIEANGARALPVLTGLGAALTHSRSLWLVTGLPGGMDRPFALVDGEGNVCGHLTAGLSPNEVQAVRLPQVVSRAAGAALVEPLNLGGTLYIFGAGHVSRSLAQFTQAVGFRTLVLDDRADYVSSERFPDADKRLTLESFDHALEGLPIDRDSYLVIVTRGHLHDRNVLAQALRTPAGYIGMIGSRRKTRLIYDDLLQNGFSEEDLARVHAPIGLAIEAETPEEIGISIVAELIQARAQLRKM